MAICCLSLERLRTFLCTFHGKTGAPISMKLVFLVQYMHEKVIIGYFELSHEFLIFLNKTTPTLSGFGCPFLPICSYGWMNSKLFYISRPNMTQLTLCLKSHILFPLKLPNDYLASVCVCFSLCGVGTCVRIGYVYVYQQTIYQILSSDEFFEAW